MEWTEDFKEEMRGRHLRLIKIYAGAVTATLFVFFPFYYYLRRKFGNFGEYDYYFPLFIIYLYAYFLVAYILLKKSRLIALISGMIVFIDAVSISLILYPFGSPLFVSIMLYPVYIMIYSIYLHPKIATRFFVISMVLLAAWTWLIMNQIVTFFPVLQLDPKAYRYITESFIKSENSKIYLIAGYSIIVYISFSALMYINFFVKKLRQREEELSLSNESISRLGEKLKVYLPHQFVESLAYGDRETLPDYRRRRLTIFFSDVRGFTLWTDKLEPEDVRELLNRYLSEMSDIAHRFGGTIDKFIGDAIMIFFGDPDFTNDKDHALRCVKMAIEMQQKMAQLRAEWENLGYEEPLRIRVGINTGYATVGNFGSKDRLNYTVLGSAVNLASRLETACEPDKITVSHSTYSLIKDEIDCEPKGQIEVKGFSEPVKIYEVIRIKSQNGTTISTPPQAQR